VAAGILIGSDPDLAFRHLLIQQALYESMPAALRTALHAEAARELAASGADVLSVAQQLSAANKPGEAWARKWLVKSGPAPAVRAPQVAAEILRRERWLWRAAQALEADDAPGIRLRLHLVTGMLHAGRGCPGRRSRSSAPPGACNLSWRVRSPWAAR
jgi:hypothetical protein